MPSDGRPRLFISYSHDSDQHSNAVLQLAERLQSDGFEVALDQFVKMPSRGWRQWCTDRMEAARYVLVVCTETYRRRAEGKEAPGEGLGAGYEARLIYEELYEAALVNNKFVFVALTGKDTAHRPKGMREYQCFVVEHEYRTLVEALTPEPEPPSQPRSTWRIPPRNVFFSGRGEYIENLRKVLAQGGAAALTQPQAIRGLGGIGKTQTAIEYAHRYRDEYTAGFWMTADSREALVSAFAALGPQDEADLGKAAQAGKRWFEENSGWLLILDNVEDWSVAKDWIPAGRRGHALITTRLKPTGGIAVGIDLPKMTPEEGAAFLMERSKTPEADAERAAARELSKEVGGLPLALEQAGAFIEEMQSSVEEYLRYYRTAGAKLRARPGETSDHASVTVTYSLAFAKLGEPAKDVVRLCAFLAPDAIPEEVLIRGKEPDLSFREAAGEAAKFSLIARDAASKTIDIHRLVQEVVKDGMDEAVRRNWAERAVEALDAVFPDVEFRNWPQCERLLPHANPPRS